ncbi:NAD-dependent epimerase/dehydratase family protein [Agarivorans sp. JK6]|uniref:NAD-dependent epimerase/dehydratase family protein n=1 Tax=Agarivorans sp. JK6 TaxID=2997426 RepID=UPI00387344A5
MRVLITGGQGNLGLWLTRYFLEKGHDVVVVSRKQKIQVDHENFTFTSADITNLDSLKSAISIYFDVCIHAASYNEHFHEAYAEKALLVNSLGTEYLCQALNVNGVGKLIYLSTFHVYGVNDGVILENTPVNPINDYGLTHYFAEKYIQKHGTTSKLDYSILRLTNGYGCPVDRHTDKWYLLLNDLCRQAITSNKLVLSSSGRARRDFIWMQDVCNAIELISADCARKDKVFNLSSGMSFSVMSVAEYVQKAFLDLHDVFIPIQVNENDLAVYKDLVVSNERLKNTINLEFSDRIYYEAINILKMLGGE